MQWRCSLQEFDKRFPVSHEVILKHGSKPVSVGTPTPFSHFIFSLSSCVQPPPPSHLCVYIAPPFSSSLSVLLPPFLPLCPKVSALTQDPSGARVATGGYDYDVRLWDFAGMDSTLQSFRTLTPCERWVCHRADTMVGRRVNLRAAGSSVPVWLFT